MSFIFEYRMEFTNIFTDKALEAAFKRKIY